MACEHNHFNRASVATLQAINEGGSKVRVILSFGWREAEREGASNIEKKLFSWKPISGFFVGELSKQDIDRNAFFQLHKPFRRRENRRIKVAKGI